MNKAILMGRICKDIELRYTNDNKAVCNFTIAVDKRMKNGDQEADFLNCQAWGKTAEFVHKYFAKGVRIALSGRISTRNYEKDGKKVFVTEVVAEEVYFADGKREPNNQTYTAKTNQVEVYNFMEGDDELPF